MKHVLIAEDDPEIAAIVAEEIGERLYVGTHIVANGALVPEAIAAGIPDLLILDIALPGLSGLEVFELLRNDPQWQSVPVLFLTASPEKAADASSVAPGSKGAPQVMAKPFDLDTLVAVVDRMVDGRPPAGSPFLVAAA